MEKANHHMIVCIVNAGFSGEVMNAAKSVGAMGGTIIHARGTVNKETENLFKFSISPEKDMVITVVEDKIKDDVLKALYDNVGGDTDAHGIAFSMPVTHQVGLKPTKKIDNK